jgi:predicted RecB family nuclease
MAKGLQHEEECLDRYRQQGRNILIVEKRGERTFQQWVDDVGNPFTGKHDDVVYQMPFIHKGVQGIADFVVKVINPETGAASYEPVDAKLVRTAAKPGHVLQLCFYADAVRELTGIDPVEMHILLASGETESG